MGLLPRQESANRLCTLPGRWRVVGKRIVHRQLGNEMRSQALDRRHVAQQLPEGDPGPELLLQGACDLAEQERVEAEGGEVFVGIDVFDAGQRLQNVDDPGLDSAQP